MEQRGKNMKKFDIEEELKKLPRSPGVYIMHDENNEILYIGKAIILKNRVYLSFIFNYNHQLIFFNLKYMIQLTMPENRTVNTAHMM